MPIMALPHGMSCNGSSPAATPSSATSTGHLPGKALRDLSQAAGILERKSFALRLASLAGAPIEVLKGRLPKPIQRSLDHLVRRALTAAAKAALASGPGRAGWTTSGWLHRGLAVTSGLAGGAFGLPGTLVELPGSTTLLLRQIVVIAVESGEDLFDSATAAECLKVFALGSREPDGPPERTDYFATRLALTEALRSAVSGGMTGVLMPGFISAVASRFTGPVALKLSAQAAPILGAAAGAAVNLAFLEHFRSVARAHFSVRGLERQYGMEPVRRAYEAITGRGMQRHSAGQAQLDKT
jgi:hypothetical protein